MEKYTKCQSCSMPFEDDKGTRDSEMYCSMCHQDGKLTYPDLTLEQMEKLVYDYAVENTNYPKFAIKMHVKTIKNLERWKK